MIALEGSRFEDDADRRFAYGRGRVTSFRAFLVRHRLAGLIAVLVAICIRMGVPTGYMPVVDHGQVVLMICNGDGPVTAGMAMPAAKHGSGHAMEHDRDKPGKSDQPCAFSALSTHALGGVDPILLAIAIAAIMVLALWPLLAPPIRRRSFLRPYTRGPPLEA